jgi:hypothetical protein
MTNSDILRLNAELLRENGNFQDAQIFFDAADDLDNMLTS